jgi:hypothetical protein
MEASTFSKKEKENKSRAETDNVEKPPPKR